MFGFYAFQKISPYVLRPVAVAILDVKSAPCSLDLVENCRGIDWLTCLMSCEQYLNPIDNENKFTNNKIV